jgi:hypothetical protein
MAAEEENTFNDELTEYLITTPVETETHKAIRVKIEGEWFWIPKSHIDEASEVQGADDTGNLVITQWIAEQKGLE